LITTDNATLGISQKPSFRSKFHLTGRDHPNINEKDIETAREHAFILQNPGSPPTSQERWGINSGEG
jgi:hypothetical protein